MARKHGQRGQCIKRGEKNYLLRVALGRDAHGKRRYLNESFHGTQKMAAERLTAILQQKDVGGCIEPSQMPLDEYLDHWLETMKAQVGPHTHADYAGILRRYVRDPLGKHPLAKITALDLERIYNEMAAKGLSRAIKYTHVTIKQAFEHAVHRDLLGRNPAAKVKPPKPTMAKPKQLKVFTAKQAAKFLKAAKSDRYGALFLLALATGMRPGEYFALQWRDVDFEKSTLSVRRSLIPFGPEGWSFAAPKTKSSLRTIQLPANLVRALRAHKRLQAKERLQAGPDWADHDLVFCTPTGKPLDLNNLRKRNLRSVLEAAELPTSFTLYSLRHSHATLSLAEGVHVKVVSERLGHSNITMTLQVYAHSLPTMQDKAVEVWERLSSGA